MLHQPVEEADLARRSVVDHRSVEERDNRVGVRDTRVVDREDGFSRRRGAGNDLFVRDEHVHARRA